MINAAVAVGDGVVAVGARGLVVQGQGAGWRQALVPVRRMLTAVAAPDAGRRLVAVGHDALVLESPDGGATWAVVRANPEWDRPLLDLWIGPDGRGLAVGAYGLVLASEDGGRFWSRREIVPGDPHLYAVRAAADGTLFVAGEFGTVLRSGDGGASWTPLDASYDGTFFGLRAGEGGRLLLYGLRGTLRESRDGGETWRHLDSGVADSLYDAVFLPGGLAVVVGAGGTVLVESPDGTFARVPRGARDAIAAVLATGRWSVLLFGEAGIERLTLPSARRLAG